MSQVRVIHLVSSLEIGGMENGVVNICSHIDKKIFDPWILCLRRKGQMARRVKCGSKVVSLDMPPNKTLLCVKRLYDFFVTHRPIIVHTHGWGSGSFYGIVAARFAKVPIVINGEHGKFFMKLHQRITQKALSYMCNATLAVSEDLKEKIVNNMGISRSRIATIENGVDMEKFHGKYDQRNVVSSIPGLDISKKPMIIGCVGRLCYEKNQTLLLQAIYSLLHQKSFSSRPIYVLLVGNGPEMEKQKELCDKLKIRGNVFFLGHRSDVERILSILHLLVLPSKTYHEGMPNVILEAMASGVPVISTKSTGASRLISNGVTGWLIEEDADELSRLLFEVASNPEIALRCRQKAKTFINQSFTMSHMIDNYSAFYLTLLSKV